MTQVYKLLPLDISITPLPKKPKQRFRGFDDRRKGRGGRPKLFDAEVRAIRPAGDWKWPGKIVSRLFGVDKRFCYAVMRGETHAHVR